MKSIIGYFDLPLQEREVVVIHILKGGEIIMSAKELEAHQNKFSWVNTIDIQRRILGVRPMTDSNRKSIIAIFETGEIKQYPNVSKNFTDYTLLNKSGL